MKRPRALARSALTALRLREPSVLGELDEQTLATIDAVRPFTMTSVLRIAALVEATRYVTRYRRPGAILEAGVWRGGSMMAVARTLMECGDTDRDLYLFDTFEGMVKPGPLDVYRTGARAIEKYRRTKRPAGGTDWARAGTEEVEENLRSTGYSSERIHLVKGRVEDTIPDHAPSQIALLRLDTDFYESTRHELTHLVPRICPNGILIIDDYGSWRGSKLATDEFLEATHQPVFLSRIDSAARLAVVPQAPSDPDGMIRAPVEN